jgi:hypothetical protein
MLKFLNQFFTNKDKSASVDKATASDTAWSIMSEDDKIRQVIVLGETGDFQYYPVLKHAILHDSNLDVKMAAIKRIHLFASHHEVVKLMEELKDQIDTRGIEPYYSMALSKMKIITIEEFQKRADKGFKL